jgi:trimethylamine---corrinoid protein Co-methyltransferase
MFTNQIAMPRLRMFDRTDCEAIHNASLEILRRTGIRVYHGPALDLLRRSDALITDENSVRFPPALVEWALEQAPSEVTLCRRGTREPSMHLAGDRVYYGPGSDCPNYLDPHTGLRRSFRTADVVDCIRLVDALPELDFCMSMGIPSDADTPGPYQLQYALMLNHTEKPVVFVCDGVEDCEAIAAMAAAAAGGMAELSLNPTLALYSEPTTPLKHSDTATGKLLFMAEHALPLIHSPAPMMGGTAPVTLAGGLALGNAEVLSSLVIQQLKRPGAPFIYGVQAHHMDMRSTTSVYGSPEYELARVASAEMGRFYRLPIWGNAGMSDSLALDEQAAADATFSIMVAQLTGTHLAHDVGYLEAGLMTSPEMVVLCAEVISQIRQFAGGVQLNAEQIALDVIHAVGPGGSFIAEDHTLRHFREAWQPGLFRRYRMADWVRQGSKGLDARLRERTLAKMEVHKAQPLPDHVLREVQNVLGEAVAGDVMGQ